MSLDDKAYLCPATSTGMRGAKNETIFQTSDETKARKLPKYDFPVSMVNVTPATHRFMTKRLREVDGKQVTEIVEDACYVFARPKYFLGSSGTVWASEFMKLRIEEPHKFELNSDNCCVPETSKPSKSINIILKDSLSYYIDSSQEDDILSMISNTKYDHKGYQMNRSSVLLRSLWNVFEIFTCHQETMNQIETERFKILKPKLDSLHSAVISMRNQISVTNLKAEIWESEVKIVDICLSILKEISRFRVPQPKSRYLEWTDAGPGVGITNNDVRYRTAQKIRIINADYLIRLHLANGDSSHNEVERCQAYVGDAICDGGALECEHRKLLDHKTIDDLKQMSSAELADYEIKRMTYNAYKVCEEVAARIDGAPGPSGYLKGFKACKNVRCFLMIKSCFQCISPRVRRKEYNSQEQHITNSSQSLWIFILKWV